MASKYYKGAYYDTDNPDDVTELQVALTRDGWLEEGNVDGQYGPTTDSAYSTAVSYQPGGTNNQIIGRAQVDNPNIAPGLPGSAFGEVNPYGDPNFDISTRPDLQEWQQANLGNPTTPEEEAAAVEQMVAARELAERRQELLNDAWDTSRENRLSAEALLEQQKQKRKSGILGRIKDVGFKFLDAIGRGQEELSQGYYAGNRARLLGGNTLEQSQATVAGLPGLGFLAPKKSLAKKAIEETNSYEERAALTKKGQLSSFGEQISGKAQDRLAPELRSRAASGPLPGKKLPSPIRGVVSGAADLAYQNFTDPLSYLLPGAGSITKASSEGVLKRAALESAGERGFLAKAGELFLGTESKKIARTELGVAAQRAGRAAVAEGRLGVTVIDAAVDAIKKGARDLTELSKRIPGLEGPTAMDVLKAVRTGDEGAVRAALKEALASGEWDPHLGRLRQLSGATLGIGVSGGVVKTTKLSGWLRAELRGRGEGQATGLSRAANQVLERTVQRAAERSETFVGDLQKLVDEGVRTLSPDQRATRLLGLVDGSGNAAFQDAAREELARVWASSDSSEVDRILTRLETVQTVLDGKAGGAARLQAEAELRQGFGQGLKESGRDLTRKAASNMGITSPPKEVVAAHTARLKRGGKEAIAELRAQIKTLEPELREPLLEDLRQAIKSKKGLGRVAADAELLRSPVVGPEALRIAKNVGERAIQAEVPLDKVGLRRRLVAPAAKLYLSFTESISPDRLPFEGAGTTTQQILRRVEGADRWAAEMGLDDFSRSSLRQAAEAAKTEAELYEAVAQGVRMFAVGEGVDPDALEALYRAQYSKFKKDAPGRAFGVDVNGKPIKENIFTKAQLVEQIPLPDVGDLKDSIRKIKKGMGVREIGDLLRAGESSGGNLLTKVLAKGHRAWKFSIVTNVYLPLIGAAAGFGSGDGLEDRLKRGAQGAAIGMLGPARYVLRVPLMEERLRVYMERGFTPTEWVPGLAKWSAQRGVDLPFVSVDVVHASNVLDRLVGGRLLTTHESDFVSIANTDRAFPDAWWRVVNRQINPESDELARIALNRKAGVLTDEQAAAEMKKYLKTEEGKVLKARLQSGTGGTSSTNKIIERYNEFVDMYITDPDLARARLQVADKKLAGEIEAEVARDTLKQAIKANLAPDYVHAQRSWVVPKSIKEVQATANNVLARTVFEGPTSAVNRVPIARSIYKDEYLRLINGGVDAKRAQEIADVIATRRTNKIMFQLNDESRFAKKADFIFPFQQPREEVFRVWGPLIKAHPGRALKATRLAALAFNNGQETGAFRKDPLSDQWVMSVPHSGWLGDHLFGGLAHWDANLKDLLLPAQGAFTPGMGVIPNPGGPWITTAVKFWATSHPEAYRDMPDVIKGFAFPYGIKGNLMRPEAARLWMGMTGSVPPWEFASEIDQKNELNKWNTEIYLQLKYDHWKKTGDSTWEPDDEEVKKALRSFMTMWTVLGSTFPASPHPITPGSQAINNIIKLNTDEHGKVNWDAINQDYPIVSPFLTSRSKYTGPDDFDSWMKSEATGRDKGEQFQTGTRRQLTLEEFKGEIKEGQRRSKAYKEWGDIFRQPGDKWLRDAKLENWRRQYPDIAKEQHDDYFIKAELDHILATVPRALQDEHIDSWRQTHNISQKEYQKLRAAVEKPGPGFNPSSPWKQARYPEDVATEVSLKVRSGEAVSEEAYVATLNPAEQVGYWKTKQAELSDPGQKNPQRVLDDYKKYGDYLSAVYKANPSLSVRDPGARFKASDFNQRIIQPYNEAISDAYDEAARLKTAMDVAAKSNQWTAVYQMKDKRDALFDQIKDLKNQITGRFPQIDDDTDLRALMVFANDKDAIKGFAGSAAAGSLPWILSNEEAHYLNMPSNVAKAYVGDLVNAVNQPNGTEGKLFWDWLTDFQRDLLQKNLPADKIRALRSEEPGGPSTGGSGSGDAKGFKWVQVNGKWVLYYKGKPYVQYGSGGGGFGGKFYQGTDIGTGAGELAYALEMFAQYSKRADGATPPATYEEYLALPNNPAVRAQYLKAHPEVGEWIKSGPLANMPELERYIVTNIMIKYGKWDGDLKTNEEIVDLSFAREQLKRWNRRPEGATAPDAYQAWLDMPPGKEKSEWLRLHPEIKDWLQLGPMANMPDEYQTIVRDIMFRYGEWTQNQDPMGNLIAEYYKQPSYARKKFLEQHPELAEYWAALRSPEDERRYQLSDQYFSIQSSAAKKAFLASHPELQEWFLEARTKRYERFINQVAQFMGSNPEMFKGYLDRQNDILAELLKRYAEPNLLRESPGVIKSQTTQGTKKRMAA